MNSERSEDRPSRRVRIRISGRVQGVAYRWSAQRQASELGLSGWVRNLPDGDVEAVFEGEAWRVECMIEWCWKGPSFARVRAVDISEEPLRPEEPEAEDRGPFEIRY